MWATGLAMMIDVAKQFVPLVAIAPHRTEIARVFFFWGGMAVGRRCAVNARWRDTRAARARWRRVSRLTGRGGLIINN